MCREHAAQLRDIYPDITAAGGDVIVIGTGNATYARDLKEKLKLPFPVLVDDGAAAQAAALRKMPMLKLLSPGPWLAMIHALRRGHKGGKPGARVNQLGGTFVLGPGDRVRYEHLDHDTADHAPLDAVLAALS